MDEIGLNWRLSKIADALERIADALEDFAYDDEEEDKGDGDAPDLPDDTSDGPFFAQEPEEPDGFFDIP